MAATETTKAIVSKFISLLYGSLSLSLFGFFLPLLDWNFGFFIGFAGAFVVQVC